MRNILVIVVIVVILLGLGGVSGCTSPESRVFFFTYPIYPSKLNLVEKKRIQKEEIEHQKLELELEKSWDRYSSIKDENTLVPLRIITVRF